MIGVRRIIDRLVGAAEAEHVDRDKAMPGAGEYRRHLAEEISPARLAMNAQECDAVFWAFIHIMHSEPLIAGEILHIARRIGPAGESGESLIGRADGGDGGVDFWHNESPRRFVSAVSRLDDAGALCDHARKRKGTDMKLGDLCALFKTEWQLMKSAAQITLCALICAAFAAGPAQAQTVKLNVDASLARTILSTVCSGEAVDEAALRASPLLQSQIRHHTSQSDRRSMDAFLTGLNAAAKCETVENDVYNFAPLVEEKQKFVDAVDFFTERAPEIESFVVEALTPYLPADLEFEGELVLSIVGNPCGGFSMDGRFYLALNCLRGSYEADYMAAKVVSAHETYHAAQYAFFHPFSEDVEQVTTVDEAIDYLFLNLLMEGTAEYVADSREIDGEGEVSKFFQEFARKGYRNLAYNFRLTDYAADILGNDEDLLRRIKDVYRIGFSRGSIMWARPWRAISNRRRAATSSSASWRCRRNSSCAPIRRRRWRCPARRRRLSAPR